MELVLSQKDPAVNESALHIYDALNQPERIFPSWPGKTVPGVKEPLATGDYYQTTLDRPTDDTFEDDLTEAWNNPQ